MRKIELLLLPVKGDNNTPTATYMMRTRSQTKQLSPDIDFDGASRAWNANKKKLANGCYEYICRESEPIPVEKKAPHKYFTRKRV